MTASPAVAAAESAVLMPVRLETRFDRPEDGRATRLRVLVIPDICWFDRHQAASAAELELLDQAVDQAGGPLVTGAPSSAAAADAFDALAAKVGGGRALWLARHGAAQAAGTPRDVPAGTRIHGLPPELVLFADVVTGQGVLRRIQLGRRTVTRRTLSVRPDREDREGWWPSWKALDDVGLAFDVGLEENDAPIDPDTIAALYVVGIGDEPVEQLLRPHVDTGDLALAHQGTPTNTIAGSRAVDRHRDAGSWRRLGEGEPGPEEREVSRALTGDPSSLGRLAGASTGLAGDCAALLIPIVWPALAGVILDDVYGAPPDGLDPQELRDHRARVAVQTGAARDWATSWLRPDGPLPILRIGDQPYGLWPVSDWARWEEDAHQVRDSVVRVARAVLPTVADRAETGLGTVVGADSARLWDLLAQTPTASGYDARAAIEMRWLRPLLDQRTNELFEEWWWRIVEVLGGVLPADALPTDGIGGHLMTLGAPVPVSLRLVLPDPENDPRETLRPSLDVEDEDEAIRLLQEDPNEWLAAALRQFEDLFRESGLNGDLWNGMGDPLAAWPPSLLWRLIVVSGLIALDHAVREANEDYPEQRPLLERIEGGIPSLRHGAAVEGYERFREALGSLRELCETSSDPALPVVLGRVFSGLLDTATCRVDPWLTGGAWQRLHSVDAPRPIGLYGWVDRPHLGQPGPDLDTGILLAPSDAQARTAVVLRDKHRTDPDDRWQLALTSPRVRAAVRLGDEVRAGAHPAEAVGREVERLVGDRPRVDALRAAFRLRTEHAGRRTCDGLAVLAAARQTQPDPRLIGAGLEQEEIDRIGELQTTLDAYADLLLADGVHHALAGRPEAAHQSMEAAAGLGMPPQMDVLATPRSARAVHTSVLARLPAADIPDRERSPVVIASPAFAAWLARETGDGIAPGWTWRVRVGNAERVVRLDDLGLTPADALTIHSEVLDMLVLRSIGAGVPGETSGDVEVVSPTGPQLAREIAATLPARPATSADVGVAADGPAGFDHLVADELHGRLVRLGTALEAVLAQLEAAATDDDRITALVQAARWGTLPAFDPEHLEARIEETAAELIERRTVAELVAGGTDVAELGRIVSHVAGGASASIPMLVTLEGAVLAAAIGELAAEPVDADGRPRLDRTWLELVAAVRPPLARIEAHQVRAVLGGRSPLAAASSHPSDPWLEEVPAPVPRDDDPRLIVAYGPELTESAARVAIGLIDGWAEVIPLPEHTASAAFRFNAPGSRAPQALLIAVTPVTGEQLSDVTVAAIVSEARLAAHARMARREDLANLDLLAGGLLPAFEPGGFQWAVPADQRSWGQ